MFTKVRVAGVLLLSGVLFLAGGCGYKTEPVPPDSIVPMAIEDLRYSVSEKGVTLTWTFPKETIRGTDLTDISTFDVYRAVVPLDDYCPTCPIPFREAIPVPGGVVDPEGNRQGTYETALLRSGHKYFFKVSARTSWWAAGGDSNIISFVWHKPVREPAAVTAVPGDSGVVISWQAADTLMDGAPVPYPVMYQVQRSKDNATFSNVGVAVSETRYSDAALQNGVTYYYRVQSMLILGKERVSGGISDAVSVVPVDRTAPGAPTGVTVVETASGIKVFWDKVPDADVKGYRVYRRLADGGEARLVGDVSAVYTIFEDNNVPPGSSVFYTVTAYDQVNPPNESNSSREAGVRH